MAEAIFWSVFKFDDHFGIFAVSITDALIFQMLRGMVLRRIPLLRMVRNRPMLKATKFEIFKLRPSGAI